MKEPTTKRFYFKEGDKTSPELLHDIGEFIAYHLGVDLVEGYIPYKGVLKSDIKIIITIGNGTEKNRNDK